MKDLPFTFTLPQPEVIPSRVDNHIQRRLSALRGQFADQDAYAKRLAQGDDLIYEVYEIKRPETRRGTHHGNLHRSSGKGGS